MTEHVTLHPAFYARSGSTWADWRTLLHPPYTLWHVSYAALGAGLAPRLDPIALAATVVAFFLAVGVGAHALDELNGRPLNTHITDNHLKAAAVAGLGGAVVLGAAGIAYGALVLAICIPVGVLLAVGYNLELFGGRLHNDWTFAVAWGGFPLLVGYLVQQPQASWYGAGTVLVAACAAVASSYAQRALSTPARRLRRHTSEVTGWVISRDGATVGIDRRVLLAPLERALRALSWTVPLVAVMVLLTHAA